MFIPPGPVLSIVVVAMTIVVVRVVSVPVVLIPAAMPAPITTPVVDRTPHDDWGGGIVALDYYRTGRGDHDGRWRHVDRDTAGADEAADHTADEPAEGGVAGVVAVGKCACGERGQGRAGAESGKPFLHGVISLRCSSWLDCIARVLNGR
jgi:hypothetical protein